MKKAQFMTKGWNNGLTLGLGLPMLGFAGFGLATDSLSARATFIGLMLIGVVY